MQDISAVVPQNMVIKVDRSDQSYWGGSEAYAYPPMDSKLGDDFVIPAEMIYIGNIGGVIEKHEHFRVTYADKAPTHVRTEEVMNLDQANLGADAEGKPIRYAMKNGRGIGTSHRYTGYISQEATLVVPIMCNGKSPGPGQAPDAELRSPLGATLPDAGLPVTFAPQRDVRLQSERIKKALCDSGKEYTKTGAIECDEHGNQKWRPANRVAPQFDARPKADGVMIQPPAVHHKHIMKAQIVDYSAPLVEDPVSGMRQPETREVSVNIHHGAHLGVSVIEACRRATQKASITFNKELFAKNT